MFLAKLRIALVICLGLAVVGLLAPQFWARGIQPFLVGESATAGREQEKLQGEWRALSIVVGAPMPDELRELEERRRRNETRWLFEGNRLTIRRRAMANEEFVVRFDPTVEPKAIDLTATNDGRILQGIYAIEGDTLTICYAEADETRPTSFQVEPRRRHWLIVFDREPK